MRIKITKNNPNYNSNITNIKKYIGQVFDVETFNTKDKSAIVFVKDMGNIIIRPDEYEVVHGKDIAKELSDYVKNHYPHELECQDVIDFILENRTEIFNILR